MDLNEECALLGAALMSVQKLEFALYGIASHLSHLPEAQKEKRFRDLTPEEFLRGNGENTKATFGQLEKMFGQRLLISSVELNALIEDRNLIAHNYWRMTKSNIRGAQKLENPERFLKDFVNRCDDWSKILNGLLLTIRNAASQQLGLGPVTFTVQEQSDYEAYVAYAAKHHFPSSRDV